MPFEPLQTDEKLDKPIRAEDIDAKMLVGCTGFVIASIGGFLVASWPFFVITDIQLLQKLMTACALGFVPATLCSAIMTRRFGLPGACGSFAGALATAVFLLLRMPGVFLAGQMRPEYAPDYPSIMQYLLPAGWMVWSALVALLLLPKGELPSANE